MRIRSLSRRDLPAQPVPFWHDWSRTASKTVILRLRTNVFIWVFVATAIPVAALALYATAHSERTYRSEVETAIFSGLDRVTSEIGRRLLLERQALLALKNVPAMSQFLPALEDIREDRPAMDLDQRRHRLTRFLVDFQSMIPSVATVRVLDIHGTTLIKVQTGLASAPNLEGVQTFTYVEESQIGAESLERLFSLPGDSVSTLNISFETQLPEGPSPALSDLVLPIVDEDAPLGFIVATVRSGPINRLLRVMPRPLTGQLVIAEIYSDIASRNGLILFDEEAGLLIGQDTGQVRRLDTEDAQLFQLAQTEESGVYDNPDSMLRTYFVSYHPYPDNLTTWLVAMRVQKDRLGAPFTPIRFAIIFSVILALLAGLFFADLCAKRIARPITRLTDNLIRFARGDRELRSKPYGPLEVRHASEAFNMLAQALETAEKERDEAQSLMLRNARLASIGQMAAGIGHEINNPVNNILSLLKLAERNPDTGKQLREDLLAIKDETRRVSRIVNAVLDFGRDLPAEFAAVDIDDWLSDCIRDVQDVAKSRGICIKLQPPPMRASIHGNRELLRQVVVNLLQNALHASPDQTTVTIACSIEGRALTVTIKDWGDGIPEDQLARVYDPFYTTKPVGEGTGMGLSLSLGIIHHHGGELTLRNANDGGVIATIVLPRPTERDSLPPP